MHSKSSAGAEAALVLCRPWWFRVSRWRPWQTGTEAGPASSGQHRWMWPSRFLFDFYLSLFRIALFLLAALPFFHFLLLPHSFAALLLARTAACNRVIVAHRSPCAYGSWSVSSRRDSTASACRRIVSGGGVASPRRWSHMRSAFTGWSPRVWNERSSRWYSTRSCFH